MIRDKGSDKYIGTDHRDWSPGQPRHQFLDVPNAEDLSEGGPEGGVIPEIEIETVWRVSAGCETTHPFGILTNNQILPTLQR